MKKELYLIGIATSILLVATAASSVTAQNYSKNASNAIGNASGSANQTMSELGTNASKAMNNTGEAVNATANELGKNASDTGSTLLNKTVEVGKKIVGGAATVLGNISGEIKQGVGAK
jgi:hypothetical protein